MCLGLLLLEVLVFWMNDFVSIITILTLVGSYNPRVTIFHWPSDPT